MKPPLSPRAAPEAMHVEPTTPVADAVLVQRIRDDGDPHALDAVFRRYASELLRLATGLVVNLADAEDVVQDVFVGLRLALRNYDERGTFRPWLRAVRTALAARRRSNRRSETTLEAAQDTRTADQTPDLAMHDALARLPETLRDVFVLKVIEGYSHAEISILLDIRTGTSEVRLFRAVRRLRHLLSESV
jgi:RNA polymerase sigma factor (sigma-70 family)